MHKTLKQFLSDNKHPVAKICVQHKLDNKHPVVKICVQHKLEHIVGSYVNDTLESYNLLSNFRKKGIFHKMRPNLVKNFKSIRTFESKWPPSLL